MNDTQHSEAILLRRYLLGQSSADERTTVERRLMSDQQYLDQLGRAEEELIDEYARGDLGEQEKDRFESLFFNVPERREKITFAQAFNRYLARHSIEYSAVSKERVPPPWWRQAAFQWMSAVVGALALVSAFFYWKIVHVREQLANSELQRVIAEKNVRTLADELNTQEKHSQALQQEIDALRDRVSVANSGLLTLALSSGWTRGGGELPTARLSPSTKRLRLELALEKDGITLSSYQAALQSMDGAPIWGTKNLKPQRTGTNRFVAITIPTSVFTAGDFRITLTSPVKASASEEVSTFYFRILTK